MEKKKSLSGVTIVVGIVILLIILLVPWYISLKNRATRLENRVDEAWSNVQASYQSREDLYSNLLSVVKGGAAQEKSTLEAVTKARYAVDNAKSVQDKNQTNQNPDEVAAAEGNLTQAMGRLLMVVENYPDLKSQDGFKDFRDNIESTENKIRVSRMDYNKTVREYNDMISTFPGSILHKSKKPLFNADPSAQHRPDLSGIENVS